MEEQPIIDKLFTKGMAKQMKELSAGECHVTAPGAPEDGFTTVYSLYYGQRASHDVLDDLVEWAERNEHHEIVEKIYQLSEKTEGQE